LTKHFNSWIQTNDNFWLFKRSIIICSCWERMAKAGTAPDKICPSR